MANSGRLVGIPYTDSKVVMYHVFEWNSWRKNSTTVRVSFKHRVSGEAKTSDANLHYVMQHSYLFISSGDRSILRGTFHQRENFNIEGKAYRGDHFTPTPVFLYEGEFDLEVNSSGHAEFEVSFQSAIYTATLGETVHEIYDVTMPLPPKIKSIVNNKDNTITLNFEYGQNTTGDEAIIYVKKDDDEPISTSEYDYKEHFIRPDNSSLGPFSININLNYLKEMTYDFNGRISAMISQNDGEEWYDSSILTTGAIQYRRDLAKARIPIRPLSYQRQAIAMAKELIVDYVKGAIYISDEYGRIINVTASADMVISETIELIKQSPEILSSIIVKLPEGDTKLDVLVTNIINENKTISNTVENLTADVNTIKTVTLVNILQDIANINANITNCNASITSLSSRVESVIEKCTDLDTELTEFKENVNTLLPLMTETLDSHSTDITSIKEDIAALQNQICISSLPLASNKNIPSDALIYIQVES